MDRIITEMAVFDVVNHNLFLTGVFFEWECLLSCLGVNSWKTREGVAPVYVVSTTLF